MERSISGRARCARTMASAGALALAALMGTAAPAAHGTAGQQTVTCGGQVATMVGTEGADSLVGTHGVDVIAGLGGDDTIFGMRGADVICGGDGADLLGGGYGPDHVIGGAGSDKLFGEGGRDLLSARDQTDDARIDCGPGADPRPVRDRIDPRPIAC